MRKVMTVAAIFCALTTTACKRQVPNDIIQKSMKNAITFHAPNTTSAMCGTTVRGLISPTIVVTKKNPDNTGTAHVAGSPMGAFGPNSPSRCEGDIDFKYSYTTKTRGIRRKTTTTTWYLDSFKLTAVQTKGVTFKPVDEAANDEDDSQQ
jgi:hypothetical protein